jgi:hypothetical protein
MKLRKAAIEKFDSVMSVLFSAGGHQWINFTTHVLYVLATVSIGENCFGDLFLDSASRYVISWHQDHRIRSTAILITKIATKCATEGTINTNCGIIYFQSRKIAQENSKKSKSCLAFQLHFMKLWRAPASRTAA